jgi:predicted SAM-dependent methyltransferase
LCVDAYRSARLARSYTPRVLREITKRVLPNPLLRPLRAAVIAWESEARADRLHRKAVRAAAHRQERGPLRLNLGCGPNSKPGWVNIDLTADAADLHLDLRRPLPFADESAELVYGEHFFEHVDYPHGAHALLLECRRVLRPGGRIRLSVPNTEEVLRAYVAGDDEHFARSRELWHPAWCRTHLDQVNYHFRQDGEHQWAYDEETLRATLEAAGFHDVRRVSHDASIDSPERGGSLIVEATR